MIKSGEIKQYSNHMKSKDIVARVRKNRFIPQYLQREIFLDVYNYLWVD